jgi:hypothetical protein
VPEIEISINFGKDRAFYNEKEKTITFRVSLNECLNRMNPFNRRKI